MKCSINSKPMEIVRIFQEEIICKEKSEWTQTVNALVILRTQHTSSQFFSRTDSRAAKAFKSMQQMLNGIQVWSFCGHVLSVPAGLRFKIKTSGKCNKFNRVLGSENWLHKLMIIVIIIRASLYNKSTGLINIPVN